MKIYLLLLDHARLFFFADESEASPDTGAAGAERAQPPTGLFGWFHTRYNTFRTAWQHADSGALLWMRRSWDWLHSWAHPDEVMLARLWSARSIDLHYPASRTVDDVRGLWADYLKSQWRRHLVWLVVNAVITPFALLLFVLPGPNLIGYWFAYRAIHHFLVVWGIGRVWRSKVPTGLYPIAALDLPIERDGEGKSRHAALTGRATRLDEHVAWHIRPRRGRLERKTHVASIPGEPSHSHSQTEPSRDG